jgi:hypothetical protein
VFRIVHDYFGHIKEGVGFREDGEENAWRSHSAMYSDKARPAMTAETRGQNSWVNFGPFAEFNKTAKGSETQYAPQKTGLLPDWVMQDGASDKRFMPEKLDSDYMRAVDDGDIETQQSIIDEAAKYAGYDVGPFYHGTRSEFNVFKPSLSGEYGGGIYFSENPETAEKFGSFKSGDKPVKTIRAFVKLSNPLITSDRNIPRGSGVKALKKKGYDGVIGSDAQGIKQYVVFDSDQVKSAEAIEYDKSGDVILPSRRFVILSNKEEQQKQTKRSQAKGNSSAIANAAKLK